MEHNDNITEKSDEILYKLNDMAKVGCGDCEGCFACCMGMGSSVVLNPYDLFLLTSGLHMDFQQLLADKLELHVVKGVILPNLKMTGSEERCVFLNEKGRCMIHAFRPGICRIFPLGRNYGPEGIRYFLLENGCKKENRTKVKVKKWIDTEDIRANEEFLIAWHGFLKEIQLAVMGEKMNLEKVQESETADSENEQESETADSENAQEPEKPAPDWIKKSNLYILRQFYLLPYSGDSKESFYSQFYARLAQAREELKTVIA